MGVPSPVNAEKNGFSTLNSLFYHLLRLILI